VGEVDDDECMHGLLPATCSICRERTSPRPPWKAPATAKRPATPRAPGAPRATAPKRPTPAATSRATLAGRQQYFGDAARGGWWMDPTGRHDEEWAEGVVRSERPPSGAVPAAARNIGEVRKGDLTIHVVKGEIVAVGCATGDGQPVSGPPAGWLVEVAVSELEEPLEVRELPTILKPGPPHPFTNQGFAQPGVCFPYPPEVAARLARTKLSDRLPIDAGNGAWMELL
jgi:hypothetical protein